ncbi:magnesium/cobalt transporter CorA [Coprobacter tertius]|uniref:Magnesium transport protein CorA n=1 Tax=Coprobacter tertius TaxID=2944915 RepID=A0ABT1MKP1_9BACT|nr:magnesium/cobalt transporter CorA [Coprobacter tertius]MCP9612609.1 magnesium/cobalt transporter CorA [Coprobacter tertius]
MHKQSSNLRKKRKGTKNDLLIDEYVYTGDWKEETHVKLIQYNESTFSVHDLKVQDDPKNYFHKNEVNWVHISGLSDTALIVKMGESLGLHAPDIQDIFTSQHIAKIEPYDDKTILVINTFYFNEAKELQQEHIYMVLGEDYVFSFQESVLPLFDNVVQAIGKNVAKVRSRSADYLFFLLANNVLGNYIDVLATLEDNIEIMEEVVVGGDIPNDFGKRIQANRRDNLQLKKSILPLKDDFKNLLHNENRLIRDENKVYLNDLEDRLLFIIQSIEICRESVDALLDLYFSNNDLRMNEIMKRLTVVATIFIPLTFVVGVWGMNFKFMPELEWKYGYIMAWALMAAIVVFVWWYIKKNRWN